MTVEELKDLIIWCKSNKVKNFKNSEVQFELSDLAFIEELTQEPVKEMILGGSKSLLDTEVKNPEEDEDLLYWSANR